jgi:hypothetical protein
MVEILLSHLPESRKGKGVSSGRVVTRKLVKGQVLKLDIPHLGAFTSRLTVE